MISVVIPLYNKEKSITRTLDSIYAQSNTDYECLIVNDGATDGSREIVELWICTKQDNRFRLINKNNGGVSSARNRGVEEAHGDYVAFLDADDLWHPTYLEELLRLIDDYPNMGLYALGYKVGCAEEFEKVSIVEDWKRGIVDNPWDGTLKLWTGSSSSSKALLLELGGFDTRMTHGEDLDMWWRLLLAKGGAQYTKPLAYYVQDSENRAMQKTDNGLFPLEKHLPYFIDKYTVARNENAAFRKYFDTQMIYRLYPYLLDNRYKKEARRLARLLDYTQLRWSMKFRMYWPRLYRGYLWLKEFL